MKPFESQPLSETAENLSCRRAAPLLMELFDGEADEISAARARAHLLSCEKCAKAWLEWNQTQTVLRSQPVPAPPPTLLWRIVLATRFATLKKRFFAPRRKNVNTHGALYSAFEPHEAPATLRQQILDATTRREGARVVPASPRWAWKINLAMPALAAPALAILLFVSTRENTEFSDQAARIATPKAPREIAPAKAANRRVAPRISAKIVAKPLPVAAPNPDSPREAVARGLNAPPRRDFERATTQNSPRRRDSAPSLFVRETPRREIRREVSDDSRPEITPRAQVRLASQAPTETALQNAAAEARVVLASAPQPAISTRVVPKQASRPVVLASLSAQPTVSRAPSVRVAAVSAPSRSNVVARPAISTAKRLSPSRPSVVLASAPVRSEADLLESDARLEEMQTVVAEFRSALEDDWSEDDWSDESES
mgnify:CR=1 FL=1